MIIKGSLSNKFLVHFEPTRLCNYRCEYCSQKDKTIHNKNYLETAKIIRDVILPIVKPDKFEVVGGEISILDPELCKIISESKYYGFIHFVTNGSNLDWFLPMVKNRNYGITISIHESQIDVDSLIKEYYKYKNLGLNLKFSIVLTKYNSEVVRYVKNKIDDILIQPEFETSNNELNQFLISHKVNINGEDKNITSEFVGKPCKCKSNMLHINGEGYLYTCHCDKYKLLDKKITEYNNDEIKEVITNYINNTIIDCSCACCPSIPNITQEFK